MKLLPLVIACAVASLLGACVGSRPSPVATAVPAPAPGAVRVPTALTSTSPASQQGTVILGIQ